MAEEKLSVKETKEAMVAAIRIGKFVQSRLADGVDWSDALAVGSKLSEPEFRELVAAGVQDYDKIPAEISDCDLFEAVDLLQTLAAEFTKAA